MAAKAQQRRRTTKGGSRQPKRSSKLLAVLAVPIRALAAVTRWLSRIDVPPRLMREAISLASACMGVLLLLSLTGLTGHHSILAHVGNGLRWLAGWASLLIPFGLFGFAIEHLSANHDGGRQRRLLGYLLVVISATTFLDLLLSGRLASRGGHLGDGFVSVARAAAGNGGAAILAFMFGLLGFVLLTGTDAQSVAESWRRIRARRQARREAQAAARAVAEPAPKTRRERAAPELPMTPPERVKPVIHVPKQGKFTYTEFSDETPSSGADDIARIPPPPLPDLRKLALYEGGVPESSELDSKAELIHDTLESFKIDATVREVFPGPAVTLFTLQPGSGVKVRQITALQNDLALALAAPSIRIEAPVPGMARVGVEVPNGKVLTVGLRETLESEDFRNSKAKLPLSLGRDVNGRYIVGDLTRMPHLLIAGATGSGKSICINSIIATFMLTMRPNELQLILIDPKMVELIGFNGAPHLKCPVVTEMDKVVGTLRLVLEEMDRRYRQFSSLGVRNIDGYNLKRQDDPGLEILPYMVVIIDELADLMMTTPEEVETLLVRLAQMARATGIHLLIATQRPSVDVLTGLIKANVPARIAFAVSSFTDSKVILDMPGAERLLGRGDMLFSPPDAPKPMRVQGPFIEDKDLQYIVRHWRKVVPNHEYAPEWMVSPASADDFGDEDDKWDAAVDVIRQHSRASASMLQRRLGIGYNRASRLIERMEEEGLVGPADGSKGRPVFVQDDDYDE
ncbi:MAG TPA: DNA translocase FtsK [Thermomicrobiaceae bacterium]|nr:DNA translocase FtsK [Thermomicrobiaceae bacterium]